MRNTKYYARLHTLNIFNFFFQSSIPGSMVCGELLYCCFYWKIKFSILRNGDTVEYICRMFYICGYTTTANHLWFYEIIMRLSLSQDHHDNCLQFQKVVIVNNLFILLEKWVLNGNGTANIITCFLNYPSWEVFPLIYC